MDNCVNMEEAAEGLFSLMRQQSEVLGEFLTQEEALQGAVSSCDYRSLSAVIDKMRPLSDQVETLERRRVSAFKQLALMASEAPDASFYQVAVRLPEEIRDEGCYLYRDLKSRVIKIQGMTSALDAYVRSVSGTVGNLLDKAIPQRRGTIYNRRGLSAAAESGPLLVSREL